MVSDLFFSIFVRKLFLCFSGGIIFPTDYSTRSVCGFDDSVYAMKFVTGATNAFKTLPKDNSEKTVTLKGVNLNCVNI